MAETRKGRLPKAISDKKRLEGKRMFLNGLSKTEISSITELHIDTVKRYAKADEWEEAKKMHAISIGEMKTEILNTFHALKNGETPKVSADGISKLVKAFQELSNGRKHTAYAVANFEVLTDALIQKASKATTKKEKDLRLETVKYVTSVMQEVVHKLYNEALEND